VLAYIVQNTTLFVPNALTRADDGAVAAPAWFALVEPASLRDVALVLAVRCGHVVVFRPGLGLFWERRLCQEGGLPWNRVRSWRSLRSVAVSRPGGGRRPGAAAARRR
jgi:hypothetical protein